MADVTEVLHRINYEVNSDALNNATIVLQQQLAELNKLNTALNDYNKQLSGLSSGQTKELDVISRKINEINANVTRLGAQSKGVLSEIFSGITKGITGKEGLSDAIGAYVNNVKTSFNKLQDASSKTAIGFAAHMSSMADAGKTSTGKLTDSIANLGKSLTSTTGLIDIGIVALGMLAEEIFSVDGALNGLSQTQITNIKLNENARDMYIDEQVHLSILNEEIGNESTSLDRLKQIRDELSAKYPGLESNLEGETNLRYKLHDSIDKVNKALVINARLKAAEQLLVENEKKMLNTDMSILEYGKSWLYGFGRTEAGVGRVMMDRQQEHDETKKMLLGIIEEGRAELSQTGLDRITTPTRPQQPEPDNAYTRTTYTPTRTRAEQPTKRKQENVPGLLSTGKMQEMPSSIDGSAPALDMQRIQKEQKDKEEKDKKDKEAELNEQRKENIKSAIDDYKTLSEAAQEAYSNIIQAQIDALDKEISIREKRVEEAKKLAERGNVEALRMEEDRLRKAQEQRARFARQQQMVNSAITVSNAIAAVARAALEGGGFGSAATIAALIAALAAGYAAVSGMTNDSEAFADGVVDYRGKGGPRDDKNWVRISSGESIITAAGTQKNRALLEAINKGAALRMVDPTLPFVMPMLKQPGTINGSNYANASDLKNLSGKLDEVVGAIESNKLRQNIFFNEQGVGIMTERAIKKERKRWM